jgi:flagellar motor switch protein FliN/FliY
VIQTVHQFLDALLDDLCTVIGARAGGPASMTDATAPTEPHWVASLRLAGPIRGSCRIGIERTAAALLAAAATGRWEADVSDAAAAASLRDLLTTMVLSVNGRVAPTTLSLEALVPEPTPPDGMLLVRAISVEHRLAPVTVSVGAVFETAPRPAASTAEPAEAHAARLDILLDIDLPVVVRFGTTDMPLRALTKLGPGSIVDLGRSPDDPVEVLVSERVVAYGEVVVVGGNYGVRILDVVTPSERVRLMEG